MRTKKQIYKNYKRTKKKGGSGKLPEIWNHYYNWHIDDKKSITNTNEITKMKQKIKNPIRNKKKQLIKNNMKR